ncbi:MAG: DUF934 domain-containing protein [Steroidobacteraceae bacterium]
MTQLIKDGAVAAQDGWVLAGPDAAADAQQLILPLADYLQAMAAGAPAASRGVQLLPTDQDLAPLQPYLAALPLIAIHFGSSGEGRGYTQARLLRERHGYRGELRAVGKVRVDMVWFLARCGFNALELLDEEDPATAIAQLQRFSVAYQAGSDSMTHPRRRYGG